MDGSRVIFMIMLILMPLLLSEGIALPFLADSHSKEKALRHAYDTRGTTRKRPVRPRVLIVTWAAPSASG